jgi:hypothetical protein
MNYPAFLSRLADPHSSIENLEPIYGSFITVQLARNI